jgi:hypothetical protein
MRLLRGESDVDIGSRDGGGYARSNYLQAIAATIDAVAQ